MDNQEQWTILQDPLLHHYEMLYLASIDDPLLPESHVHLTLIFLFGEAGKNIQQLRIPDLVKNKYMASHPTQINSWKIPLRKMQICKLL